MNKYARVFSQLFLLTLVAVLIAILCLDEEIETPIKSKAPVKVELKSDAKEPEPEPKPTPEPEPKPASKKDDKKSEPKILATETPYNDGDEVLNDKGKIKMWNLLERQRETRHDFVQIVEAQNIFSELLLTKCDTNVFLVQVVMDGLDSLRKNYEDNNIELIGIDSKLIYYRYYLKEGAILKE
jgi:hypothetical protein